MNKQKPNSDTIAGMRRSVCVALSASVGGAATSIEIQKCASQAMRDMGIDILSPCMARMEYGHYMTCLCHG